MLPKILGVIAAFVVAFLIVKIITAQKYKKLESEVLQKLGFPNWNVAKFYDYEVIVKSRQTLEKYDDVRFFKEHDGALAHAHRVLRQKADVAEKLIVFSVENEFKGRSQYKKLARKINETIKNANAYRIHVTYISSAGNNLGSKAIELHLNDIDRFTDDPSILMGKMEYNRFLKAQQKEELSQKQRTYYESINKVVDFANEKRDILFIKGSVEQLDSLIAQLYDETVRKIQKIKTTDSIEWEYIDSFINRIYADAKSIVSRNEKILEYYKSNSFIKLKSTCDVLMNTQREFNEYIESKVDSISLLFGTRVTRNETVTEDEYQYVRPYKKTITPFTAEVSAAVFASAENNPIDYVIKNFYPNKDLYPEQIQKLHTLVDELETLHDAKQIINRYKEEYQQYLVDVPDYVMTEDENGFYSRLGFANIDESTLVVEYKFSYTSGGGMAKRSFTVPMTEETIVDLIKALENKLSISAFTKEQRALMTHKLREQIKSRDNFTCCICGNSVHSEPNLLLEIDHIVPVSKGGCTIESNLQTLCWKCNRAKSNKCV